MSRAELKYALGWALVVMCVTCVSYVVVWWVTPLQAVFPLVLFNSDDQAVYFAWTRQAQDGHLLFRNLFTTEPQHGATLNLYFVLLGLVCRLTTLSIPVVHHLARILFGAAVLVLAYRLAACFAARQFERRCAFWLTAVSGGLGWLFWSDHITAREPVDVWQPEAMTFACLYTNGLFCASLALMLGFVICLVLAEEHGARWALGAGLCGLVLGNIHSYDVIHLALVWTAYLAVRWLATRRFPARAVGMALLAALVTSPSVLYMAWLYLSEPVFRARADTETLTPGLDRYLLGYGVLIPLAITGAVRLLRSEEREPTPLRFLPPAWAIGGMAAAYLPFAFQRKMVMGVHLPIALLAGLGLALLCRWRPLNRLPGLAAAIVVALCSVTACRYLARDVKVALTDGTTSTGIHPAYWDESLEHAWKWISDRPETPGAVFSWPWTSILTPAMTGRAVFAGHWGETPGFAGKLDDAFAFYWGTWDSARRREFLRTQGIRFVIEGRLDREFVELWRRKNSDAGAPRPLAGEAFLSEVFREGQTVVYEAL